MISKDIKKAVALLNQNELVAIPTETVYGLAGNIYSEQAVKNIFATKKRPFFNPLIVHIPNAEALEDIASYVPEKAKQLAQHFWPGSLTLVLPKQEGIPDIITAGKDTVAVRVPNHPTTLALLKELEFPLAAPSANPFNSISPTKAEHVAKYFKDQLKMVLDGGPCQNGIESTIIGFDGEEPVVYRLGAISVEEIEAVVGKVHLQNKKEENPEAPGMLKKHYAPKTKLILCSDVANEIHKHADKKLGVLSFSTSFKTSGITHEIILSKKGSLHEAAQRLYNALHELDLHNLDLIIAEKMPEKGLGISINDRLERASQ